MVGDGCFTPPSPPPLPRRLTIPCHGYHVRVALSKNPLRRVGHVDPVRRYQRNAYLHKGVFSVQPLGVGGGAEQQVILLCSPYYSTYSTIAVFLDLKSCALMHARSDTLSRSCTVVVDTVVATVVATAALQSSDGERQHVQQVRRGHSWCVSGIQ